MKEEDEEQEKEKKRPCGSMHSVFPRLSIVKTNT